MPTYEYKCKDCEEGFEVVQAFTDDALTECPSCHGDLKKVFGNIGISFKGSGFYKNDAGSSTESSSTSDTTSDSKPAAKQDSATKDSATKDSAKKSEKSSA